MRFTDEERAVRRAVREFAETEVLPVAVEAERTGEVPDDLVETAAELDLLAPGVPEEYGGGGMGLVPSLLVTEEIHRADPAVAAALSIRAFGSSTVLEYGTEDQKESYVRPAAEGREIRAVGMTEPGAGSDFASIQTSAERDGDEYVVDGEKVFISNGAVADQLLLYARTSDTEEPHRGISSIVVETDREGVEQSPMEGFMGPATDALGRFRFDGVRVPADNLVGEEDRGFYQAMEFLDEGRLSVAALSVGSAQGALDLAVDYVTDREAFGEPVAEKQAVRHRIAGLQARIDAVRSFVYDTARDVEAGRLEERSPRPAMAKLLATELAEDAASEAVQLHGGYGCFREYRVGTFFRASKAPQIYEGTSEILREVIADAVID